PGRDTREAALGRIYAAACHLVRFPALSPDVPFTRTEQAAGAGLRSGSRAQSRQAREPAARGRPERRAMADRRRGALSLRWIASGGRAKALTSKRKPAEVRIPFNQPFLTGRELAYIAEAHANHHLSGDGPFTKRCHAWLERTVGCPRALLTHSCTAALE